MADMTPNEAIATLRKLSPDKQREVLTRLSPEKRHEILLKLHPNEHFISGPPKGIAAIKSAIYTARHRAAEKIEENIPAITGTVGGLLGIEGGLPGVLFGAALGGAAGRAAQQLHDTSQGNPQPSSSAAAWDLAKAGGEQAAYELAGMGMARIGRFIKPVSRAARLSYGGGAEMGERELERLAPEFDKTIEQLGGGRVRTVGDFEKVVDATERRLNTEYALALHPIAGRKVVPTAVADAIRSKITPNMMKTPEGRAMARYLQQKATQFEQEWSVQELNLERETISKRLRGYHSAAPSSAAAKGKLDAAVMADSAAEDALKEMLYDAADRSADKPSGYFRELKRKQSLLIDLADDVEAHKRDLLQASAKQKGTPLTEKVFTHGYTHPASTHAGMTAAINPAKFRDPLKAANRSVAKAFPSPAGKVVAGARQATGWTLETMRALPVRYLFLSTPPPPEEENATDAPASPAPVRNRREALERLGIAQ